MSLASSTDFALGTDNWTVEWFAYPTSTTQYQRHFYLEGASFSNIDGVFADSSGIAFGRTGVWGSSTASNPLNQWNHYALVHDSTNMRLYINGVQVITDSNNFGTDATKSLNIGYSNSTFGGYFTGNISNFRILKGTALYTSNFTPPTTELEVTPETVLLCCHDGENIFAEKTGKIIAAYGDRSSGIHTVGESPIGITTNYPPVTRGVDVTAGPVLQGNLEYNSQNFLVLPKGTTEERSRGRGLNAGGGAPYSNTIEYIQIQTLGNAQDFGDLTLARAFVSAVSSPTRAVFTNGYNNSPGTGPYNMIDYVTIATTGNAVDFGAETASSQQARGACSNNTRGVIAAGSVTNVVEYITIATLGTIETFGEYGIDRYRDIGGCSSSTRGLFAGGFNPANTNSIEYITIATTGNTQSFGDLTTAAGRFGPGAASSPTRGVFMGGDTFPALTGSVTIDYVTIASLGDAQDFGDLLFSSYRVAATSNGNRAVAFRSSPSPAGVNNINYITIATTGNAQDFGDRFYNIAELADSATSDSHGGLS